EEVLPGQVAERAVAAVTGCGRVDDVGAHLTRRFVTQAKSLHRAGPEVRHDHVGFRDEAERRFLPELRFQIEHQAALVAVGEHEERAHAVAERLRARPVALPRARRRLDLGHVRAKAGQMLHGGRAEQELRERRDANAFERAQGSGQSTSCMMWSATHTSSPCWFFTSTFEMIRSRSRSSDVITYSMLMVSPRYTGLMKRMRS